MKFGREPFLGKGKDNEWCNSFFNKIWLKLEEHEYIYIFEIKLEKKVLFKNGGQNNFCDIVQ